MGLDIRKIREKVLTKKQIQKVSTPEVFPNLIFLSGFSSRDEVSQISGRGIGMDAVKAMAEELGGTVSIRLLGPENQVGFAKFEIVLYLS